MPLRDYLRSAPFRIAARYAALFAASVLVLFGVVFWKTTQEMTEQLQSNIDEDLAPLLAVHRREGLSSLVEDVRERIAVSSREIVYLLEDGEGRLVSGNIPAMTPFDGWQELALSEASGKRGTRMLSHGMRLEGAFLLVGRSTAGIAEVQRVLARSLGWTLGLTVPLALLGGIVMSHGALRRLDAINASAQQIVDGNLSQRVPVSGGGDELDRVARTMNRMLDRIEELMNGLRQVTTDIAHDLRTPLGRLRQRLEAAQLGDQSGPPLRRALDSAIADSDSILSTFDALLRIAHIEAGARKGHFQPVDLSDVAATILEVYQTVADDSGQVLEGRVAPGVTVPGDRELLTQMLANLVENALRHTAKGTRIAVAVAAAPHIVVAVEDDGPGIPATEREKVLGRFYRLERSRTTPGNGLGLSLVKAIAGLHDASLELSDRRPGLRVAVVFPERR